MYIYGYDVDMFAQIEVLKEAPAVLSLGKFYDENGFTYEWHQSYLITSVRDTDCKNPTFPWLSQPCKQQNTRPRLWPTRSWHKLWATTSDLWKQNYQNGFNHSRKDGQRDRGVRHASLQLTWKYHRQHVLFPRILPQNLLRRKAQCIHSFSQRPVVRRTQTHESYKGATQKKT